MFSNLIESGSHERDLKRRGTFFIGTFLFYTILLTGAGIGSIYAYNVRLDASNEYELLTIMRFTPAQAKAEPDPPRVEPKSAATRGGGTPQIAEVREVALLTPRNDLALAREDTPILAHGTPFKIGDENILPVGPVGGDHIGPVGPIGTKNGSDLPVVTEVPGEAPPMRPTPTPAPPQRPTGPVRVPSSILSGKATHMPAPPYPIIAKQIRQQGAVAVQIVVDEQGRVVSAKATNGPSLLLQAAEKAAYQARFTPTTLNGQPVKISGVITYNFILQ